MEDRGTLHHSSQCLFFIPMKSESWLNNCVNIRLTHPPFQKHTVFSGKIWYNVLHGTYPTTTALHLCLCAGQCDERYSLFPTNGGADEAGLYRTQVGSELLASPTCSACGA